MRAKTVALFPLALALALPAAAAQRAFVASTGNDANVGAGCTPAAPCRSFQAAHTAVDAGGEIVALDTAGYGAVTVSKSVTIMANPGAIAGIAVSTGNAVMIGTPGVAVILRGLALNNVGSGGAGVQLTDGSSLSVENCVISNFGFGIFVTTNARVGVANSTLRGNNTGLFLSNGATGEIVGSTFSGTASGYGVVVTGGLLGEWTSASVTDSVASNNGSGFAAINNVASTGARLSCIRCTSSSNVANGFGVGAGPSATSVMSVSYSKASFNDYGFTNAGGIGVSLLVSQGNNSLYLNNTGTTIGTITPYAGD